MKQTRMVVALLLVAVAVPGWAKTYKYSYANPCSEIWPAVKVTLSDAENYAQVKPDDEKMTADYQPKHSVHVDISGTVLQRMNHVTLVAIAKGAGCEMQVVSNWSGWGHEDQGDFKKRVDESMVKLKAAPPAEPTKPADEGKPADPATQPAQPTEPATERMKPASPAK
jgi:hypothetical protein